MLRSRAKSMMRMLSIHSAQLTTIKMKVELGARFLRVGKQADSHVKVFDGVKIKYMHSDVWIDSWKNGDIGFHSSEKHPQLVKYLDKLTNRKLVKFFFPMCGKAVDMKWLAELGHTVVGVEYVQQAIEDFFKEQNLKYTLEDCESYKGKVYKSLDGLIRLYCGDLFDFSSEVESSFDAIFDRGSLVAINLHDRQRYANLMYSLLSPDGACLLEAFEHPYGDEKFSGPHAVFRDDLDKIYGENFHIDHLETQPFEMLVKLFNLSYANAIYYLLKVRSTSVTFPAPAPESSDSIHEHKQVVDGVATVFRDNDRWAEMWESGLTGFHMNTRNPMLVKYLDKLVGNHKAKILFPFCGKSVDMKWVADLGHTVVGVEYVQQAIEEFCSEQGVDYTVDESTQYSGKLFKSDDGRTKIYCGDFYDFSSSLEGHFDVVIDRAALVAVNRSEREKYVSLIQSLVAPDGVIFVQTFEYPDDRVISPFNVTRKDLEVLFGQGCDIDMVDKDTDEIMRQRLSLTSLDLMYYTISVKK